MRTVFARRLVAGVCVSLLLGGAVAACGGGGAKSVATATGSLPHLSSTAAFTARQSAIMKAEVASCGACG